LYLKSLLSISYLILIFFFRINTQLSQCAHGLKYLHTQSPALIHGDVKAVCVLVIFVQLVVTFRQSNILIDNDGSIRLTDFGLISISETENFRTTIVQGGRGSTRWMAPELFQTGIKKSRSSDIYAFGMTIIEVINLKLSVSLLLLIILYCTRYIPGIHLSMEKKITKTIYRSSWRFMGAGVLRDLVQWCCRMTCQTSYGN
jgi:serine/threonine protein kinase